MSDALLKESGQKIGQAFLKFYNTHFGDKWLNNIKQFLNI